MYIVKIQNNEFETEIHGNNEKLKSGTVQKGINCIDSFSCVLLPSNKGFGKINDMKTRISVFNTNRNRYEFWGRVLQSKEEMTTNGLITKDIVCESYLGFFNDSIQTYVEEQNWTVLGLLTHIVDVHNSKVEPYKQFEIGYVTVTDPNDNLYCGIQRENTWKTLNNKLINAIGGELRLRVENGVNYIDYLKEIGTQRATSIELSKNMQKITREKNVSAYITRLIPLGCKLEKEVITVDEDGNSNTEIVETEERLNISSVNGGLPYIDDQEGIQKFGIIEGIQKWDDITNQTTLYNKGLDWLRKNNKVLVKYSITALDLSLLGLDIDDFDVGDWHPIINPLLTIDDSARIIKKTIDVIKDNVSSSIEVGDNLKTLTEIQLEQSDKVEQVKNSVGEILKKYVTNEVLKSEDKKLKTLIEQTTQNILLSVKETYTAKTSTEELNRIISSQITELANRVSIELSEITTTVDKNKQETTELSEKIKYEFDTEDFTVSKEGADTSTHISENGMRVKDSSNTDVLKANSDGVDAKNLHANTYLIIGKNSRLEDYNENRTGIFWIGN